MDNIVHIDNDRYAGRTNFRGTLLADAVIQGCSRVEGVETLRGDFLFRLRHLFRRRTRGGVRIRTTAHGGIVIDLCLIAQHGYLVPDISYRVQEAAITAAQTLTEKKVKRVNVRIIKFVDSTKKPKRKNEQKTK